MRLDRISGRRLVTLVAPRAGERALRRARRSRPRPAPGSTTTSFLVWNLVPRLAAVPVRTRLVRRLSARARRGVPGARSASSGCCSCRTRRTSSPTSCTSESRARAPLWFDALTDLGRSRSPGLLLGLGSLFLVQTVVSAARGPLAGWATGARCARALQRRHLPRSLPRAQQLGRDRRPAQRARADRGTAPRGARAPALPRGDRRLHLLPRAGLPPALRGRATRSRARPPSADPALGVAKGYAEGPAAEEAERRRDELAAGRDRRRWLRRGSPSTAPPQMTQAATSSAGSVRSIRTSCSRPAPRGGSPSCAGRS